MAYLLRTGGQILPQSFGKYSEASREANRIMDARLARRVVVVQSSTRKELRPLITK
jgi:hypothetical protein